MHEWSSNDISAFVANNLASFAISIIHKHHAHWIDPPPPFRLGGGSRGWVKNE